MPTIFSRIASGEIPSVAIYNDARTYAFLDISPASRGHALVIPRDAYPDLFALPPDLLAAVAQTVQRVALAIRSALRPDGINIVQNNGAAAGQTVLHYHVHLIPRWNGDGALALWEPHPADSTALEATAAAIRAQLGAA
ncbi:MAG: HIT family protein [Chloroflexales bacterium]|nr:HIT family protein [Chloroflexales bacterium]